MTINEFKTLTNLEVTSEEFGIIHADYVEKAIATGIDKQQFCLEYLQSFEVSKAEKREVMKRLKGIVSWNKKHYKEYLLGKYEYNELDEQSFLILDNERNIHNLHAETTLEELSKISITKIVYIADITNYEDTISGNIYNMYSHLDYESENFRLTHIEKTIERMRG